MSPSRTFSPGTMPAGSVSYSQAPTYSASPSVRRRTSVRSVTGAPSCSSRWMNPVSGATSSHAGSFKRPSMTGGVTTARAVAVGPWAQSDNDNRTVTMERHLRRFDPASECVTTLSGTVSPCRSVNTVLRRHPRSSSTTK